MPRTPPLLPLNFLKINEHYYSRQAFELSNRSSGRPQDYDLTEILKMIISLFNESFDLFDKLKADVKVTGAGAENKLFYF